MMNPRATMATVDETIARFHDAWRVEAPHLPLSRDARASLEAHHAALALAVR